MGSRRVAIRLGRGANAELPLDVTRHQIDSENVIDPVEPRIAAGDHGPQGHQAAAEPLLPECR